MNLLQINLFGSFRVSSGVQEITGFRSQKARALLAYLAVEAGHPSTRDKLAALFWAESSDQSARTNLRHVLSNLRTLFAHGDIEHGWLDVSRQHVTMHPHPTWQVDTTQFEAQILQSGLTAPTLPTAEQAKALATAAALYTAPFLDGFFLKENRANECAGFELWRNNVAVRLHQQITLALQALIDYYQQQRDLGLALRYAHQWLAVDPTAEEGHYQVMQLLAATGQPDLALVQYERCRQILWEEQGIELSAATTELYRKLLQQRFTPSEQTASGQQSSLTAAGGDAGGAAASPVAMLPAGRHRLVGRAVELRGATEQLTNPNCRLLSFVGPGGIGKSELALQVARENAAAFTHGAYFIPLVTLSTPQFLPAKIAEALQLAHLNAANLREQLLNHLRAQNLLLLFDNYEQLLPQVDLIGEILAAAPAVKIIVTSRERLRMRQEWVFNVGGLQVPTAAEEIELGDDPATSASTTSYGAIQLFVEQAQRIQPDLAITAEVSTAITQICRLLAGSPLAIELVVGWIRLMSCTQIATELTHNMDLLAMNWSDLPARHRSMRAVFEQTWQQLAQVEQRILQSMGAFHGKFDLNALQSVVDGVPLPLLLGLVDKSIVNSHGDSSFSLHELWRRFALEKLHVDPVATERVKSAHAAHYAALLAEQTAGMIRRSQKSSDVVSQNLGNVEAAWSWSLQAGMLEQIEAMLIGYWYFLWLRGTDSNEITELFAQAAEQLRNSPIARHEPTGLPGASDQDDQAAKRHGIIGAFLVAQGSFFVRRGDLIKAVTFAGEGISQMRQSPYARSRLMIFALRWTQMIYSQYGEYSTTQEYIVELIQLAEMLDNQHAAAAAYHARAVANFALGDFQAAKIDLSHALPLAYMVGDQHLEEANKRLRAMIMDDQGEFSAAYNLLLECLDILNAQNDLDNVAQCLHQLGLLLISQGDYVQAEIRLRKAMEIMDQIGADLGFPRTQRVLGLALGGQGRFEEAILVAKQALLTQQQRGQESEVVLCLRELSRVTFESGAFLEAELLLRQTLGMNEKLQMKFIFFTTLPYLGYACLETQSRSRADIREYFAEALALALEEDALPWVLESLTGMAILNFSERDQYEALTALKFVAQHPSSKADTKARVETFLSQHAKTMAKIDLQAVARQADALSLDDAIAMVA